LRDSGWIVLPCPLQSVCRPALSLAPRRVSPLRRRHGHHSHVRKSTLLISYLESYLNDLQLWLNEWRIVINISKNTAKIFVSAGQHFIQPRTMTLFGESIKWVATTRYLGVAVDKRLTWSPHIDQVRKKSVQRMGMM
jgi:hypothetical protein